LEENLIGRSQKKSGREGGWGGSKKRGVSSGEGRRIREGGNFKQEVMGRGGLRS